MRNSQQDLDPTISTEAKNQNHNGGITMNQQRKMPAWQSNAIEVIQQFRDGLKPPIPIPGLISTFELRSIERMKVAKRDNWGKVFLANMEAMLLALDTELLGPKSTEALEKFLSDIVPICYGSTNVQTRKESNTVRTFANHVATPALSRAERPDECVRVLGEAIQKYYAYQELGADLAVNATSLTYRDFMETVLKPVEKEFKSIRV